MTKMWRVALHDYLRHVLRKRFIFALLSLPLVVLATAAVGAISVFVQVDTKAAGYVDLAGITRQAVPLDAGSESMFSRARLVEFGSEAEAQQKLDAREISAFFVIEPDYAQTGAVRLVAFDSPGENVEAAFSNLLRRGLLADVEPQIVERIIYGSDVTIRSSTDDRESEAENWFNLILPIFVGIIFIVVINTSGGYLLQAVVEEK
ncbi:MAG: ABC transporter permease, partial [Anaerolineaceae bacterium]